ncbi:organic cation transporter 1-like [Atheta coriaria]|uniref:organic cation transporter 1-like n=1 Tax=Dalotia coriaria TaxID=877792 RepID=UPI0031F3B285
MTHVHPTEEPSAFDTIIEQIGKAGRFQKRFNFTFNFFLVIVAAMPHLNLVISLATPNHWCHVPGRETTNYSIEEWKSMTLPKEYDSKGHLSYSKCKRYVNPYLDLPGNDTEDLEMDVTNCDSGWEYDHTWYDQTAPMQNDWVCDNNMVSANTLALGRAGEVIGTLIFGQLADNYGRMPVFYATVVTLVIGRAMSAFTSPWVSVFIIFSMIGSLPSTSVFQGPLIIAMEISRTEDRALISMMQCFGWNAGMVMMPLLMWWLRDWVPFMLVTSLPCAIFLLSRPWMIESPRWLASKGKIKRCYQELEKVAKTNKTDMPNNTEAVLKKAYDVKGTEKNHTILGLFSSPRLAKNTIMLVCCWSILLMIYMCLTINVNNLGGNPFLNYLFQAVGELPAYMIGKYVSDHYGRRWTSIISFILTSLACVPIIFVINDIASHLVINSLCIFLKFSVSLAFYSVNLQSMEIYPTCVRQTGISVGVIFGSGFGVVSPYIVALGTSVNAMLPYLIFSVSSLVAAVCCLFLPETFGHQLPETLEDASNFGADQNIWGRSTSRKYPQDGADVPLKQPI